ncbi:M15 family metallopeptidase [Paenibacillus harenae]|uniref:D-alanyl-D-alanine carboxypeptidase n=1 Tax=Paenibacillus harenae TaxID=306543 RepID=A0ABT9U5D8_PAEHA|nr:M15 family metallopeptidase [Paenibacillus harenae]MDQ0114857.1 D-alanyl-D-alanine carboxypeptidase [Paenibacillus harenae]
MTRNRWTTLVSLTALAAITLCVTTGCDGQDAEVQAQGASGLKAGSLPQTKTPQKETMGDGIEADKAAADRTIEALVNREHPLAETEIPEDLVKVDVPTVLENPEVNQLREEPATALKLLFSGAREEGFKLYARSGYRSFKTQEALFAGYAKKAGEDAANRYSARAGQSEHQTGLAVDVTSESVSLKLTEDFGETEEGIWLAANAHKYGFIIRYPKGKEDVTGYIYEPWHIRYLGVELATDVFKSGLTYEEYVEEKEQKS